MGKRAILGVIALRGQCCMAYPFTLIGGSVPVSTGSTCGEMRSGVGMSLDELRCVELPPDVLQFDAPEGSPCLAEEVVRCWEIEDSKISVLGGMAVRGRLRQHIDYWVKELHATQWIMDMIRDGYTLPFYVEPPAYRKNTAYANADFVHNAVADLVKGRFVVEIAEPPYVSSPLSVVENSTGKKRLVVNLRHINQFLSISFCGKESLSMRTYV